MRKLIPILFFWSIICIHSASAMTGDSLRYLLPQDTVFIVNGNTHEKIFYHTMESGQTLYSLSKFYGMNVYELYAYNPEINPTGGVAPGTKVRIPLPNKAIVRYPYNGMNMQQQYCPVFYVVKEDDTLYGISQRLFEMPMDTLMQRNGLENAILQPGQKIRIGWVSTAGVTKDMRKSANSKNAQINQQNYYRFSEQSLAAKTYKERGKAVWDNAKGSNSSVGNMLALHPFAKLNSYIVVTNPMTKRVVYAKVIGRIPQGAYGPEVKVVLSSQAASALGARDPRFYVELSYVK